MPDNWVQVVTQFGLFCLFVFWCSKTYQKTGEIIERLDRIEKKLEGIAK